MVSNELRIYRIFLCQFEMDNQWSKKRPPGRRKQRHFVGNCFIEK